MADAIRQGQVVDGKWLTARKTQLCGREAIVAESQEVKTPWGATLTGKRGDYVVFDAAKPEDRWVVERTIFDATYEQAAPDRFRKKATVQALAMSEPFQVETLEGVVDGAAGDYLARGAKGEYYVIPRGFFDANYVTV